MEKIYLCDETEIYRYIPRRYIKSLLEENNLFFSKIKNWPDMMELFLDDSVNHDRAGNRYGICWTLHKGIEKIVTGSGQKNAFEEVKLNGVDSMWNTYCPNGGVRIKTTIGKVRKAVVDFCEKNNCSYKDGFVSYQCYKDTKRDEIDNLCFIKSPNFYTDDEYRFVITIEKDDNKSLYVNIENAAQFVDEILVSPPRIDSCRKLLISNKILDYLFCIDNPEFNLVEINERKSLKIRKSVLYGKW